MNGMGSPPGSIMAQQQSPQHHGGAASHPRPPQQQAQSQGPPQFAPQLQPRASGPQSNMYMPSGVNNGTAPPPLSHQQTHPTPPLPGPYQNGARMIPPPPSSSAMTPAAMPPATAAAAPPGPVVLPNINAEIQEMQTNLKTYMDSGEHNPEVDKKIVEVKGKLESLLRHQAATTGGGGAAYPPLPALQSGSSSLRMSAPAGGMGGSRTPGPRGGQPHGIVAQPHQIRPVGLESGTATSHRPAGPSHASANSPVRLEIFTCTGFGKKLFSWLSFNIPFHSKSFHSIPNHSKSFHSIPNHFFTLRRPDIENCLSPCPALFLWLLFLAPLNRSGKGESGSFSFLFER